MEYALELNRLIELQMEGRSADVGAAGGGRLRRPRLEVHERQSFDPADFPVPTGREEEWRFTPPPPPPRAAGR